MTKIVSAENAIRAIPPGATLCVNGFVGCGTPEELLIALEDVFGKSGEPGRLTVVFAAAPGDGARRGLNRLAAPGLVSKAIGGHWSLLPCLAQRVLDNEIEGYNLPLGCLSQLYRDIAGGRPGLLSRVGLHTFVDPRQKGGRLNERSTESLVELVSIGGEEFLFYRAFPIDVVFLRGTTADTDGNVTMEDEPLALDALSLAMAVYNRGGIVIVQVRYLAACGSLDPHAIRVPGCFVTHVVVAAAENHLQTYGTSYDPALCARLRVPVEARSFLPLDERKIIARRAAMEIPKAGLSNLGIGIPEGVASVVAEECLSGQMTLTTEPGIIGGVPLTGADFGAALNPIVILPQSQQFDLYDGGGLSMAVLGMAQVDKCGNVNVSRFNGRLAGAGGFINITQNTKNLIFTGSFTTSGLQCTVGEGRLSITQEGRHKKFVDQVEEITFNGRHAIQMGLSVLYVTERCVFRLVVNGLELIEVAPGVDINSDILAHMEFTPLISAPRLMNSALFRDNPVITAV